MEIYSKLLGGSIYLFSNKILFHTRTMVFNRISRATLCYDLS